MNPISGLYRSGFSLPIDAMMFREFGCTGHVETIRFHALSGGKTSNPARIVSASGALNGVGLVMTAASRPAKVSLAGEQETTQNKIAMMCRRSFAQKFIMLNPALKPVGRQRRQFPEN